MAAIDSLEITIAAQAQEAIRQLDTLIQKLAQAGNAIGAITGKKINIDISGVSSAASQMEETVKSGGREAAAGASSALNSIDTSGVTAAAGKIKTEMAGASASVREHVIEPRVSTGGMDVLGQSAAIFMRQFESATNTAKSKWGEFQAKLDQIVVPRIEETNVDKLTSSLNRAETELEKLRTKLANGLTMGMITESPDNGAYARLQSQIAYTEKEAAALRTQLASVGQGSSAGTSKASAALNNVGDKAATTRGRLAKFSASVKEAGKKAQAAAGKTQSLTGVLKTVKKRAEELISKIPLLGRAFSSTGISAGSFSKNLSKGLTFVLRYAFGIRSIFMMARKLQGAFMDGINNMVQYSGAMNSSVSAVYSSISTVKNAMAAAAAPLIEAIAPVVSTILDMITDALNAFGQLMAALTGKNYAIQAKKYTLDYAASLGNDDASDVESDISGLEGVVDSTTDSVEELQAELTELSVDQLHKLNGATVDVSGTLDAADIDTSGIASATANTVDVSDMFDTTQVSAKIQKVADNIRDVFGSVFDAFKKSWDKNGQAVTDAAKYAWSEVKKSVKLVGDAIKNVFNSDVGVEFFDSIFNLLEQLLLIIGDVAKAFNEAWKSDGRGEKLVEAFLKMFTAINELLADIAQSFRNAWNSGTGVETIQNILDIFTNIFDTIGAIAGGIDEAWTKTGLGDEIWGHILGTVKAISDHFKKWTEKLKEWAEALDWEPLLASFNNFAGAVENLVNSIMDIFDKWFQKGTDGATHLIEGVLPGIINGLASVLNFFAEHQALLETILSTIVAVFAVKKVTVFASTVASFIDKTASGISKWQVILTLIIALIITIIANWDDLGDIIETVVNWFVDHFGEIKDLLPLIISLIGAITVAITAIKIEKLIGGINKIKGAIQGVLTMLKANAAFIVIVAILVVLMLVITHLDEIKGAIQKIKAAFDAFHEIVTQFLEKADAFLQSIPEKIEALFDIISEFFSGIWTAIKDTAVEIWDGIVNFIEGIPDKIMGFFESIGEFFSGIWAGIKGKAVEIWNAIVDFIKGIPDKIMGFFKTVVEFYVGIWTGIKGKAVEIWNKVVDFIKGIPDKIMGFFKSIGEFFSGIWTGIKGEAVEIWNKVVDVVSGAKDKLVGVFEAIRDKVKTILEKIKNVFRTVFDGIKTVIKTPINAIIGYFNTLITGVETIINGIANGLNKISVDVPDWVPLVGGKHIGFALSTINITRIPTLATGGMVDAGQMFIANEAGPEMVGNIGGETAVANTEQITNAIAAAVEPAVYKAVVRGMKQSGGTVEMPIYLDGKEIYRSVLNQQKLMNRKYNLAASLA